MMESIFFKNIRKKLFLVFGVVFSFTFLYHSNSLACGNPGGTCFLPGSLVTTSDGTKKPIEEVKVGDEILGYDIETGDFSKNKVGSLMSVLSSDWYEIAFVGGENLKVTKSHPIYIKKSNGKIGWGTIAPEWAILIEKGVKTEKIEEGDFIFNQDGNWQRIDKIIKHNEFIRTYNLMNVGDSKTFFVEGLLVHNKTCFVAGTKISMADGSFKKIEDVKIGDNVLGKDDKINKVVGLERPIVGLRKTYIVNDKIEATGDHPFLTTAGWKVNDLEYKLRILENSETVDNSDNPINKDTISQLKIGDILFTKNGQEKIETIEIKTDRQFEEIVYDLNLNGDNTYFANDYLVHNCGDDTGGSICEGSEGAWSSCSATTCGTWGTRSRSVSYCTWGGRDDMICGCTSSIETEDCYAGDCVCSASCDSWSSWSSCSATTCGTYGTQSRSQTCTKTDCSTYTNSESQDCYAGDCCTRPCESWGSWSSCDADCDKYSTVYRYRRCFEDDNGSCAPVTETDSKSCYGGDCPSSGSSCTSSCGSWSSWSSCNADCDEYGTQSRSRTCTRTDCSAYTDYDSQSCYGGDCAATCTYNCRNFWNTCPATDCGTSATQSGVRVCRFSDCSTASTPIFRTCYAPACDDPDPDPDPVCVPDCSCASSQCVGSSCPDGCGGSCSGTYNPGCGSSGSYCPSSGYNNGCYWCTGTKTCSSGWSSYNYSCSSSNVLTTNRYWNYYTCSGTSCNHNSFLASSSTEPCGTETCAADGVWREYCKDGDVWERKWGKDDSCTANSTGCDSNSYYYCDYSASPTEPCEVGYICKEIDDENAECVPKTSTWTED